MKKTYLLMATLLILALGVGCAAKPNDAKIASDIQNKFSQDSGLGSKQLGVQSDQGTVTLSGTVDNDAQREAAGRLAAAAGAKTVINNLQVAAPAAMQAAAAAPAPAPEEPAPAPNAKPSAAKNPLVKHKALVAGAAAGAAAAGAGAAMAHDSQSAPPPAAPTPAPEAAAPPPPPPPVKVTIAQGTQLSVRLSEPLDTKVNQPGQSFHATLNTAVTADGDEVVPAGSEVIGHIVDLSQSGKFTGSSALVLQLDSLTVGNKSYNIQSDQYKKDGPGRGKNTAEKVGGGAVLGGIIGALAGGGKGAAIGATVGAGAGGGVQAASKAPQIKIPAETILGFTLQAPVTVVKSANPNANRPKLPDAGSNPNQ